MHACWHKLPRGADMAQRCAAAQRQRRLAVWSVSRRMQAPPAPPSAPAGQLQPQPWTPVHRLRTAGAATPSSASKKRWVTSLGLKLLLVTRHAVIQHMRLPFH